MSINDEIVKINSYLAKELWMDFEVYKLNAGEVILSGFLDEMDSDKIRIKFIQPYMMVCTMSFTFEGGMNFISVLEGEEAIEMNKKYQVTEGNNIFMFSNTNINSRMFLIAKKIEFQILE